MICPNRNGAGHASARGRFIGEKVRFQSLVSLYAINQLVELGALCFVVENGGIE